MKVRSKGLCEIKNKKTLSLITSVLMIHTNMNIAYHYSWIQRTNG